jgi:hypothetical protein
MAEVVVLGAGLMHPQNQGSRVNPVGRTAEARQEIPMNVDRAVFAFAGTVLLVSLVLAWLVSPYWLLLSAFVGLNMLQAAFTGFCPAAIAFRKLGIKAGSAFP